MKLHYTLICLFWSGLAFGKPLTLQGKGGTFQIDLPEKYEYYQKFMALENVIMAPASETLGTASLSIYFTGLSEGVFDAKRLEATQSEYQAGRKQYIQEKNLQLVEFIPYILKKNPQSYSIHTIGTIYTNGNKITSDKTYLVECPTSFIHSKIVGDFAMYSELKEIKNKRNTIPVLDSLEKIILNIKCPQK